MRKAGQWGGIYRRCSCKRNKVPEGECPHPWYIRIQARGPDGVARNLRRSIGPGDAGKTLALRKLAEAHLAFLRNKHFGEKDLIPTTLKDFWPVIRPDLERRMGAVTFVNFAQKYRILAAYLTEGMSSIGPARVKDFLVSITPHTGPATRNRYLDVLSMAFRLGIERGYAVHNPAADIKREREKREPPPRVTAEDVRAICAHASKEMRALFWICYLCGLRKAEAMALCRKDIDLERKVLLVRRGKGGKSREIPLSESALAVVMPLLDRPVQLRGEDRLFPAWSINSPTKMFERARKAAGVHKCTLHNLRAAFITGILESGGALTVARDLAGHASVAVTNRYASSARSEALRAAVDAFAPMPRPPAAKQA